MDVQHEISAALAVLANELQQLDLTAELEALETNREAQRELKAVIKEAVTEVEQLGHRLHELRGQVDHEQAATAYLAGTAPEDIEAESSVKAKLDGLHLAIKGLRRRERDTSEAERPLRNAIAARMQEAAAPALEHLRAIFGRVLEELDTVAAASKVIGEATASGDWFSGHVDSLIVALRQHGVAIDRVGPTPEFILEALAPVRAKIEQGRGRILEHIIPPPTPREERPAPQADPNYKPGRGGNMPWPQGGLRMTNL